MLYGTGSIDAEIVERLLDHSPKFADDRPLKVDDRLVEKAVRHLVDALDLLDRLEIAMPALHVQHALDLLREELSLAPERDG